jgi:UDP-hydrolysing UDP-N-acetyl-D-glucosamine 2-epimerase
MQGNMRISVVTGSRADYGLLAPLLRRLEATPGFDTGLLVTGAHLSKSHGCTASEIAGDGFRVDANVALPLDDDTAVGTSAAFAYAVTGVAAALARLRPELVVVLGDRYEILAAAVASQIARVPVAHLHGGESTLGAVDDAFRHAVTKLSLLHFVSTEEYRDRVVRMGEDPERVHCVGALGLDNIRKLVPLSRRELEERLGFDLGERYLAVTFHPVTLESDSLAQTRSLLDALDAHPDLHCVFSRPNADPGNLELTALVEGWVAERSARATLVTSLGSRGYLSLVREAAAVVGNSSSGILEAPALGVPVVDIGNRQQGRIRPPSVIHCPPDRHAIASAIAEAICPEWRALAAQASTPYGDGHAAERIVAVLKSTAAAAPASLVPRKPFYDPPTDPGQE